MRLKRREQLAHKGVRLAKLVHIILHARGVQALVVHLYRDGRFANWLLGIRAVPLHGGDEHEIPPRRVVQRAQHFAREHIVFGPVERV